MVIIIYNSTSICTSYALCAVMDLGQVKKLRSYLIDLGRICDCIVQSTFGIQNWSTICTYIFGSAAITFFGPRRFVGVLSFFAISQ